MEGTSTAHLPHTPAPLQGASISTPAWRAASRTVVPGATDIVRLSGRKVTFSISSFLDGFSHCPDRGKGRGCAQAACRGDNIDPVPHQMSGTLCNLCRITAFQQDGAQVSHGGQLRILLFEQSEVDECVGTDGFGSECRYGCLDRLHLSADVNDYRHAAPVNPVDQLVQVGYGILVKHFWSQNLSGGGRVTDTDHRYTAIHHGMGEGNQKAGYVIQHPMRIFTIFAQLLQKLDRVDQRGRRADRAGQAADNRLLRMSPRQKPGGPGNRSDPA